MIEDFVCTHCKKEADWDSDSVVWRHKDTGLRHCADNPYQEINPTFVWRTGDTLLDDVIEDVTNFGTERL